MNYFRLGNTALRVSGLGLGTVEIGMDYGIPTDGHHLRPAEQDAIRLLNEALDLGVNFIDTARVYGTSEEVIGRALEHRRKEYVIATKLAPVRVEDLQGSGLRDQVRSSVTESLRKLRTDWIDLLLIHSAPAGVLENADELLSFMDELRQEGKVRYIGASVYEEAGPAALRRGGFDCLQIAYSALDRSPEEVTLPLAVRTGVGIVARSVLLKGALTPRYIDLPEQLSELKKAAGALQDLAGDVGMTLPELAYRYVLESDVVALCGTGRLEELRSAVEYVERGRLDAELISRIRQIEIEDRRFLNPGNWQF
jgi:aryl-alcohol dehydrogenase-like predicted oxidoreductase